MHLKCSYQRDDLNVDYYPNLLGEKLASEWYNYLEIKFPKSNGRSKILFGDEGLIYKVSYQDVTNNIHVLPWNQLPNLFELKQLIETITGHKYTVCSVQCYPNGKVGINPHRDKEMIAGTSIAGLSLGAKRTISFTRNNYDPVSISLAPGSLYVMNPPTNQKWLHSIVKDSKIKEPRYSLTFRNYES